MILYIAVFAALIILCIARIPVARRVPHARTSWRASLFGALAISTLIPVSFIDHLLWGGQNIIYLVQCYLATLAFWFFAQAALIHDTRRTIRRMPRLILVWCVVFSVPFFFIQNRTPTEDLFIRSHVDQLAAVICAALYMIGIAVISVRLILGVRRKSDRLYWIFRVSAVLIIFAIATQIAALVLDHFKLARGAVNTSLYACFDPLFYLGVIGIGAGMGSFSIARVLRTRRTRRRVEELSTILSAHHFRVPDVAAEQLAWVVYTLVVAIADGQTARRLTLNAAESAVNEEAIDWIEEKLPQLTLTSSKTPRKIFGDVH